MEEKNLIPQDHKLVVTDAITVSAYDLAAGDYTTIASSSSIQAVTNLSANHLVLSNTSSLVSNTLSVSDNSTARVEAYTEVEEYFGYKVRDCVEIVPKSNRSFEDLTRKEENSLIGQVYTITKIETAVDAETLFNSNPFSRKSSEHDMTKTRFFISSSDINVKVLETIKVSLEDLKRNFKRLGEQDLETKNFLEEKLTFNLFSEEEV